MNFPVFDLHCDTALALVGEDFYCQGNLRENTFHIDLERAKTLPGYAQCFACYTSDLNSLPKHISVIKLFELELQTILREVARNSDWISLAYTAEEIRRNAENGIMSALLTIEGTAGISYDLSLLEDLYKIGFRISTLGWNESNPLTGSHITGEGLSPMGREYVREAQRLGMVIDVSHISAQGFWDIMEITNAPVIASHSNSRSVCDVSRNLTDDMFLAICQTGGVVGINQYALFLGKEPTIDTVCDHICHFLELDPGGKHIALGGDLDGCDTLPAGFTGVQDYPKLAAALKVRGLDDQTIMNMYWNNAIGVIERCCM